MSKIGVLRFITKIYISVMRGNAADAAADCCIFCALLCVRHEKYPRGYRMVAVILAFVLNYAAYFAEIPFRNRVHAGGTI